MGVDGTCSDGVVISWKLNGLPRSPQSVDVRADGYISRLLNFFHIGKPKFVETEEKED